MCCESRSVPSRPVPFRSVSFRFVWFRSVPFRSVRECIDPLDDTRDARWTSLTSVTMRQNHAAETWSRAPSRRDKTTCWMRASTNQGTDKREKSRKHTESKIQGDDNTSHRGPTNTAFSQRPEGYCLSQKQNNIVSRRERKGNKEKQMVVSTSRDTGYHRIKSHLLDA